MIALGCLECLEVAQVGSGMITNGAHFRLVLCIQGFGRVPSPPGVRSDDWGIPMLCSISDLEDLNWLPGTGSCWMALSLSKSLPFLEVVGLNKSTSSLDVCLDFKRPCICETKGKSLEIMRIYCANIVLMYCIYIYIYVYLYIYISYISQLVVWSIWMIRTEEKAGWIIIFGASSEVVMSGFAYPILADSVWGDGPLLALGSLPDTLMKYRFLIFSDHTIELQDLFTIY